MIFLYQDYKLFLRSWISSQESNGRGIIAKIALHLNVSASLISTILNSDERHFAVEQACDLAEFLKLSNLESEYFIALVSYEKAGSEKLRKYWNQQRKKILKESEQVKSRIQIDKTLTDTQQAQYYSHAIYSQIRVLCTLDRGLSNLELNQFIKLPTERIQSAIDFLIETQLLTINEGRYFASDSVIHISKDSPHYLRHHMNWRLQQLQQVTSISNDDITYTFPCTLNKSDFKKIKTILLEAISQSQKIVKGSPAEDMACLTIDFISYL